MATSSNERTKSLRKLLISLRDIPTVNTEYDVLGYVYEYLISQFSAGAGKKSGEFFTPSEVSTVISRIIFYNLRDRQTITVYDPTVGFRVIIVIEANSYVNIRSSRLLPKFKTQKINSWCAA